MGSVVGSVLANHRIDVSGDRGRRGRLNNLLLIEKIGMICKRGFDRLKTPYAVNHRKIGSKGPEQSADVALIENSSVLIARLARPRRDENDRFFRQS